PPGVAALGLPTGDEVEALVELGEEARDLGRVVLQVAVDRHDDVAARVREPGHQRRRLAEVAAHPHDAYRIRARVQPGERRPGAVGRAVVDEDRFPLATGQLERDAQLLNERRDAALLVVDRDDDREHGGSVTPRNHPGSVRAVADLLPLDEAIAVVLAQARPLATEPVELVDALGRVLAEPAVAATDLPPFPSSSMDGFAVRAADTPATLAVVGHSAAGVPWAGSLVSGQAVGIATGAVVPS